MSIRFVALVLLVASSVATAQDSKTQAVFDPFSTDPEARYRSYPTTDGGTLLLLDTATGALWQMQLGDGAPRSGATTGPGRYPLAPGVVPAGEAGRFAMIRASHWDLVLLDQAQGHAWSVRPAPTQPFRSKVEPLEERALPTVERP